jgi:predicted DNA-binding protein with PD1-like motif
MNVVAHRFDPGPVHLLRLPTGADLYRAITDYVQASAIEAASVTFLGAVERAALRYYDQVEREYRDFLIDEHLEVVAGVGNVSMLDGEPFLHIHAALADDQGRAFGGHVNEGTAVFAIEVTIHQLEGSPPQRRFDERTGLNLWEYED